MAVNLVEHRVPFRVRHVLPAVSFVACRGNTPDTKFNIPSYDDVKRNITDGRCSRDTFVTAHLPTALFIQHHRRAAERPALPTKTPRLIPGLHCRELNNAS